MAGHNMNITDKRFCKVALNSLKTYRHVEFTIKFMKENNIKLGKNLSDMWTTIEKWLNSGDISRCNALLQYTDNLRMWGRQRIFLFEIAGKSTKDEKEKILQNLSNPDYIRKKVGEIYDNVIYRWEAEEPFIADVYHKRDSYSNSQFLIFKLIETRKFEVSVGMKIKIFEKRSTNFFIVDLKEGFAQLILEQLPTGAQRDINEERQLFEKEIAKYLPFEMFSPIELESVMLEMIHNPIYPITYSGLKTGQREVPGASTLMIILNHMFQNPIPNQVSAYYECEQKVVEKPNLYFKLNGNNNSITFDGLADPDRIRDIVKMIVDIYRGEKSKSSFLNRGWVHRPYKNLHGQPKAQAVILAAGAVAASILWILIEGIGNYILEDRIEKTLKGIPLVVFTLVIEFFWILFYYGWNRIKRSFAALLKMNLSDIWATIRKSKKLVKKDRQKFLKAKEK